MGDKYVTLDGDGFVVEPFDSDNGNVPADAVPISQADFELLRTGPFNLFRHADGVLSRRADADDVIKAGRVENFVDREVLVAFAQVLVEEINTLRAAAGLPGDRTITQVKNAIRAKL